MTPREIIAEAWAITTREPSLRRWAFTASLLETLLSLKLIGWQLYVAYEHFIGGGEAGFFDLEIWLYNLLPIWLFLPFIITIVAILLTDLLRGISIGLVVGVY